MLIWFNNKCNKVNFSFNFSKSQELQIFLKPNASYFPGTRSIDNLGIEWESV